SHFDADIADAGLNTALRPKTVTNHRLAASSGWHPANCAGIAASLASTALAISRCGAARGVDLLPQLAQAKLVW
ncbi:hypothetical protein, partial [Salmonella enterica]|uniref:hypothetical protein n=1 Tax=Salmonella enterica TaxID=28901 RepID=UPI001BAF63FE